MEPNLIKVRAINGTPVESDPQSANFVVLTAEMAADIQFCISIKSFALCTRLIFLFGRHNDESNAKNYYYALLFITAAENKVQYCGLQINCVERLGEDRRHKANKSVREERRSCTVQKDELEEKDSRKKEEGNKIRDILIEIDIIKNKTRARKLGMMNNTSHGTSLATNSTFLQGPPKPDYLKIAAYCLIIILSLVGNSLVIAVIYKNANKRMRTPSNYFVVNMAVGDGLITIVNMVAQVIALTHGSSLPFSGYAENTLSCKMQNFVWIFLISWSTGSLSAIAVDRFLLVFVPLRRIITLRIARAIIVTILLAGAAISWPLIIFSTLVEYGDITLCTVNMSSFAALRVYYIFLFVAFIFFPLLTLLILYTAIGIKMWLRKSPGNQEATERMNRKVLLMLVTIVVLFALCWMPVASLYFGCFAYPSSETCGILMKSDALFTLWFVAYSNSAINPYVYFIFNGNFRNGARMICSSIRGRVLGLFSSHNQVGASIEMNTTGNDCAQRQTINEETMQRDADKL